MKLRFSATISPDVELLAAISELSPYSPFNTPKYAAALKARNSEPCAFVLYDNNRIISGCIASLAGSRWLKQLNIFSAPSLASPQNFWEGVFEFCSQNSVCYLDIQTFASCSPQLPSNGRRCEKRQRSEFILDLSKDSLTEHYSKNHKRSISKARGAGVTVTRSHDQADYGNHIRLMQASMARRSGRGEVIEMPRAQPFEVSLLNNGAAEIFQAQLDAQAIASVMILHSKFAGYYHSAGTSPGGMQLGASPFLISSVAEELKSLGYLCFNLGGADPDANGLRRFKNGFDTREIALEAANYPLISPLNSLARRFARNLLR